MGEEFRSLHISSFAKRYNQPHRDVCSKLLTLEIVPATTLRDRDRASFERRQQWALSKLLVRPSARFHGWFRVCRGWAPRAIVMKHNIQKRTVDMQIIPKIVIDKAKFPEPVHEKTDPRTGRAHHLRQRLLA